MDGEDRWANGLTGWDRIRVGASGLVDAAGIATATTGLAKTAMLEFRGAQLSKYTLNSAAEIDAARQAGRHVLKVEALDTVGAKAGEFTIRSVKGEGLGMFGHTEPLGIELAYTKGWVHPGWGLKLSGTLQPCNRGVCRAIVPRRRRSELTPRQAIRRLGS